MINFYTNRQSSPPFKAEFVLLNLYFTCAVFVDRCLSVVCFRLANVRFIFDLRFLVTPPPFSIFVKLSL